MKTDRQLRDDVLEELAWEPAVNETDIGVEVKDGIVTLSGQVASFTEKVAAQEAVERVSGVKGLAIEIEVNLPGHDAKTDMDIASAARTALELDMLVPSENIKLVVEDGRLTLSGYVRSDYQRRAAERDVRNLRGVKDVKNNVIVRPILTSGNIRTRIESALQRRAHVEAKSITVAVKDDEVTLTGTVPSLEERSAAVHAAWCTPGVGNVVNHIAIAP